MELTKIERLSLINQYLILEKLYPEEKEHYSELRQALENGYTLHYSWCFDFLSDDMPIDECKKVLDILDLYRSMDFFMNSYRKDNKQFQQINETFLNVLL